MIPDRIEAATYLTAAAITRGRVEVANCRPDHLKAVTIQNGLKRLHVATEAGNNPALNLYAANGFKFYDASISLYRLEKTW